MKVYRGLRIRNNAGKPHESTGTMTTKAKAYQFNWRKEVGERPTDQNQELFHSLVEQATVLIEEFSSVEFIYSEVRQVCQPAYLFSVVCDMRSDKLSMRIHTTEEGWKVITIHKVWRLYFTLGNQGLLQPSIPTFL